MLKSSREVELQNIIKMHESKIHSLKTQISQIKEEEVTKIQQAIQSEKHLMIQKEKSIVYLKEQINKVRKQCELQISLKLNQQKQYISSLQNNLSQYKSKCQELQIKINQLNDQCEAKEKQKQKQRQQSVIKYEILQREKKILMEGLQKVNRFYANAVYRLPERQETLLWVDKLIEFMSKTNNILAQESKDKQQSVISITKWLKQELSDYNNEFTRTNVSINSERQKFINELSKLIGQAQQDYNQALKSNQQFWDNLNKIRVKEDKQQLIILQNQIATINEKHQKEIAQFNENLLVLEKQKKNLLLGFQQMKSLYDIRDKTSKDEIDFLKQQIKELLSNQEKRQRSFQEEIKRFGEKIQSLTIKFYQQTQLPILNVYRKIREEVQQFRNQFQGFYTNSAFQNQIQQFQNVIVEYLTNLNTKTQQKSNLRACVQDTLNIMQIIRQDQNRDQISVNHTSTYNGEASLEIIKERENKLIYDLSVTRKHLQKLKEHCKQLESKVKINQQIFNHNSKYIQITAQNQALKQRCAQFQRHIKQLPYNEKTIFQSKIVRLRGGLLEKLVQNSDLVLKFFNKQDQYIDRMTKCISSLNSIVINPVQVFENIVKQVKNINFNRPIQIPSTQIKQEHSQLQLFEGKKSIIKDIISRKNQNNNMLIKSTNDLVKLIREYISKNPNSKNAKAINQSQNQVQRSKPLQSKMMVEKRIKDVQSLRIKNREEMLGRIKILDQKFKTMEQKNAKKTYFPFVKFEQGMCKKIQQLLLNFNLKDKLKDFSKVSQQALEDARSKLNECLLQNQGLVKEVELLKTVKSLDSRN